MPIKVGRIPHLSCEPFYYDMERRGIELHDVETKQVAAAAENGEIDAGPVPLVDCFRLEDHLQPLSGFCIASVNKAVSSNLYSKRPVQNLGDAHISATDEDPTSLRLLQVLLSLKHNVQPAAYDGVEDSCDALLLSGNQGLRRRRGVRGYPHKYDLGEEWREWTGLPFVFARWMVRKDMDPKDTAMLEDALFVGQKDWLNNLYRMTRPREDILMRPRDVLEYIQSLRFFAGVPEGNAIDLFRQYLDRLELDTG